MIFRYRDFTDGWVNPIVIEIEAEGIVESDKMYKEWSGKDVIKQHHIGCCIIDEGKLVDNFSFNPHDVLFDWELNFNETRLF